MKRALLTGGSGRLLEEARQAGVEQFIYISIVGIAQIVGKSEANCRQIVSRARRHIAERRPRFEVSHYQQTRAVEQFMHTLDTGDLQGLPSMA